MSNLEKEIANKNKQSNKEKKHAEKVAARTKRQEYIENTIEAVKSNTTDIVATSFEILKDYIKETKQNHQTIDAAKNRYEDYINFANTYQNFPVTYTNENGENVTVVQTENGPIFKTEHHT